MFAIIGWIISGLFIGALARWFYPGAVELGWIATILLGIGGSFVGGFLGNLIGGGGRRVEPAGCIGSVVGAMLIILLVRAIG